MNKTKIIALFTAIATAALVMTGCASNKPTTLSIWHVYGSQTESPMNDIIDEFNKSVGKDKGIFVEVTSVSDSSAIDEALVKAAQNNSDNNELPDMFTAYPRIVNEIDSGMLLDWNDYFSEKELDEYVADFLNEGYFDNKLLMFPIAKSTELFFLNKTLFDRFSDNTDFSDFNDIFSLCNQYYDYSGGKTMLQLNDFYHYFLTQINSLGGNFIENGKINADSEEFETAFIPLAKAAVYGGISTDDGYASDKWKTAELISSVGSTAGIMYMRDYVTYENGNDENIETAVYTYPTLNSSNPCVIQRGTGIFGVKSDDKKKNKAMAEFVKWLTQKEQNLNLATEMGYLPVTKTAFDELLSDIDAVENPKYRLVYQAVSEMYDNYSFTALPVFDNCAQAQKNFEKSVKSVFGDAHKEYAERIGSGEDKETVMNELVLSSLKALKEKLQ